MLSFIPTFYLYSCANDRSTTNTGGEEDEMEKKSTEIWFVDS